MHIVHMRDLIFALTKAGWTQSPIISSKILGARAKFLDMGNLACGICAVLYCSNPPVACVNNISLLVSLIFNKFLTPCYKTDTCSMVIKKLNINVLFSTVISFASHCRGPGSIPGESTWDLS